MASIAIYLCLVGIVPVFAERPLIVGVVELGQAALLIAFAACGYLAARPVRGDLATPGRRRRRLRRRDHGVFLTALVLLGSVIDIRAVFLNASPELYALLTNGNGTSWAWFPIVVGAITGAIAGIVIGCRAWCASRSSGASGSLVFFGLFAGLLRTPMLDFPRSPNWPASCSRRRA